MRICHSASLIAPADVAIRDISAGLVAMKCSPPCIKGLVGSLPCRVADGARRPHAVTAACGADNLTPCSRGLSRPRDARQRTGITLAGVSILVQAVGARAIRQ